MRGMTLPELGAFRTPEALRKHQASLLAPALAHAARASFYAGRLRDLGRGDLTGLPFTTKEDLRAAYPFGLLAVTRRELATYHESSGTTGEPTASYLTERDWDDVVSRFARSAVSITADDVVMVKTPYAMVTTAHQMHAAARKCGALVVPADNRSRMMTVPRVLRLLRDLPVSVAWCMPTEALLWTEAARITGEPAFERLRAFVVAGEPLSNARRRRLESIWSARVFEDYGSTETGSLAGECPAGALHLWADRFIPEVVDVTTGAARSEGVGQLAITTLYREAMPLVRYLLEDTVEIDPRICECGWSLPRVRVIGRPASANVIGGRPVTAGAIDEVVFSLPRLLAVSFWRARPEAGVLAIEIEVDAAAKREAEETLTLLAQKALGQRVIARGIPRGTLVPDSTLRAEAPFSKPRFLFAEGEDWSAGLAY